MKKIEVVEVGARDGLQNENQHVSVADRLRLVRHLGASGLRRIEAGAFVSPTWVPQMIGSGELIKQLYAGDRPAGARYAALVPNPRGMTEALTTPIEEVAVFGASTESFSRRNINCSIADSHDRFREVIAMAKRARRRVRGYLSVAFGCPFEGEVPVARVIKLVREYLAMGIYEVSIGDTIGVATPRQVDQLLTKLGRVVPARRLAMHFHDTRGTALANVTAALPHGVRTYDSSFGGLGGCPYADGASGNLATEDLVYMLHGMGFRTDVDLNKLLEFTAPLARMVGRKLPSRTSESGLPRKHTL